MKVALTWASPENPPGSAHQAIRGHVTGLQGAGHDVDVFYGDRLRYLPEYQDKYDFVIWPSNHFNTHQIVGLDIHKHLHLIGVDTPGNPTAFREAIQKADTISAVDPNCTKFYMDTLGVDLSDARIIPNAPNIDVFSPQPNPGESVFVPKSGASQKEGDGLIKVAKQTPNVNYETRSKNPLGGVPFNVEVLPAVSWSQMERLYSQCSFVLNPAKHEGLPNVAYEAFLTERAYCSRYSSIGRIQTLPESVIDTSDFGLPHDDFDDIYADEYYYGDHYLAGEMPEGLRSAVKTLVTDASKRQSLATAGRDWVESLANDWSWVDVSNEIVRTVTEQ